MGWCATPQGQGQVEGMPVACSQQLRGSGWVGWSKQVRNSGERQRTVSQSGDARAGPRAHAALHLRCSMAGGHAAGQVATSAVA